MTPLVWAQTADSRPHVPALALKPSRQHLTCRLEPLTSMMIASYCTSVYTANFQICWALFIALHLLLLTFPWTTCVWNMTRMGFFLLFLLISTVLGSMRKTWLIYLPRSLTWHIIRSEGLTVHYPHNKASPARPTRVSAKLQPDFVHNFKSLCHVWAYFTDPLILVEICMYWYTYWSANQELCQKSFPI